MRMKEVPGVARPYSDSLPASFHLGSALSFSSHTHPQHTLAPHPLTIRARARVLVCGGRGRVRASYHGGCTRARLASRTERPAAPAPYMRFWTFAVA